MDDRNASGRGQKFFRIGGKRDWVSAMAAIVVAVMAVTIIYVTSAGDRKKTEDTLKSAVWQMTDTDFTGVVRFNDGSMECCVYSKSGKEEINLSYEIVSSNTIRIEGKTHKIFFDETGMTITPGIIDENKKSERWFRA